MKIASLLGCLVGTTLIIAACGGGGSSAGGGGGNSNAAFVTQYCDTFGPCCSKQGKTYDASKCQLIYAAFTAEATYDPVAGQSCLDAVRLESNNPTFCESGLSTDTNTKCNGVFKQNPSTGGTKKAGDPCDADSECATTAEGEGRCATAFVKSATIRQCQIEVRGKEGEECIGEKEVTASGTLTSTSGGSGESGPAPRAVLCYISDGLFCESTFSSGSGTTQTVRKCVKTQEVGGPCQSSSSHACVKTAFCDTTAKQCVARRAAGDACTGFGSSSQCVEKHFCDTTTKKCTPSVPAGGACTRSEECEGRSCTNGKCGNGSSSIGATLFVCQ